MRSNMHICARKGIIFLFFVKFAVGVLLTNVCNYDIITDVSDQTDHQFKSAYDECFFNLL